MKNLSHKRSVQLDIKKIDNEKTTRTIPGYIVIKVLITNLILKSILFKAPILRLDTLVNILLCKSIDLPSRYNLKNIGNDKNKSIGTVSIMSLDVSVDVITRVTSKLPGIGCIIQIIISNIILNIRLLFIAISQSSIQLSIRNN